MTAYQILGIGPDANSDTINMAYQRLYDLYKMNGNEEQIQILNTAYHMIMEGCGHLELENKVNDLNTIQPHYKTRWKAKLIFHLQTVLSAIIGCCIILYVLGESFQIFFEFKFEDIWFIMILDTFFIGLVRLIIYAINKNAGLGLVIGGFLATIIAVSAVFPILQRNEDFWTKAIFVMILAWIGYSAVCVIYYTFKLLTIK